MISSNELKNAMTILYEDKLYSVIEFMHVKPGKGSAFVRSKLRNLRTGAVIDKTFRAGEPLEKVDIDKRPMQYSYEDGDKLIFLDTETWEQIEISKAQIEYEMKFLTEGLDCEVLFYGTEIIGVNIPDKVVLEVKECQSAVKGDTKTSATKDAIMETGLLIQVPLFVEQGEKLIVSTITSSYVSREKK